MELVLALTGLMTPLLIKAGGITMRLFDLIIIISCFVLLIQFFFKDKKISIPFATLLLIPFFLIHIIQARHLGLSNIIREGLQSVIIIATTILAYTQIRYDNWQMIAKYFYYAMTLILAVTIGWHVANGHITAWKLLNESKIIFSIFPILFAILALQNHYAPGYWRQKALVILLCYIPVVILSGERKALLITLILCLAIIPRKGFFLNIKNIFFMIIAVLTMSAALPFMIELPYVQKQIASFTEKDTTSVVLNQDGTFETKSLSNAQRAFAWEVSKDLVAENTLFGIGTNMYKPYVHEQFGALPEFLKVEIHSEFQRALVELGVIGLLCYLLPIIRALFWLGYLIIKPVNPYARDIGLCMIPAFIIFMGTEGGGTQQMIMYIAIALYPDFTKKFHALTSVYRHGKERT